MRTARPVRTVWNVLDPRFGGQGDGVAVEDDAVRGILAECAPGDEILFPAGRSYVLDSVTLTKPVTLDARGATLVKSARTATHMFLDTAGAASGTRVLGGTFEMNRDSFRPGQTVSPFHFVRARDLVFRDLHVRDGIEEGLKLYGCRTVRVLGCRFERIRNNGVQLHNPAEDGHTGTVAKGDSWDLVVAGCHFLDVDDGLEGTADGQGVTFNSTDTRWTTRDGVVQGCVFERCVRGIWAEFGGAAGRRAGRNLYFAGNRVLLSRYFGIGMIGVEDGAIVGNEIVNAGVRLPAPPRTSSEIVGVVISGDSFVDGARVVCAENEIHDHRGRLALMEYGIWVKRGTGHLVRGNRVSGATRRALEVTWANVRDSEIEGAEPPG